MFGRRKKNDAAEASAAGDAGTEALSADDAQPQDGGPYDVEDIPEDVDPAAGRLDLGSVLVPMPDGAQVQVEMTQAGAPQAVHIATPHGRITVAAYAAPKSPGQWREVAGELADSLRADKASVSVETGPWGREVFATTQGGDLRFIGADGYRWMVRVVAAGPAGANAADSQLATLARGVLRETVVRRGTEPHPVRTPLPVVLPKALADQLATAHQQQMADQQARAAQQQQTAQAPATGQGAPRHLAGGQQPQGSPVPQQQPPQAQQPQVQQPQPPAQQPRPPRRGDSGSAMQQLGY
ncbi:DUF3710 domain-containing protein [Rhodococcus rhodnii]|uniref:DUF3710 domain-containing protein n=2 Tax=Rhodococcus rhodnii TaxID=38312 RepID=R7WSE2_9NOCA|nr:DUF3710 domain-containing protein [Rhodococcus rhodnii]EOM78205.1 hypothetical protein Rrhod_0396 [Rhodococcus rhodnii LMG 5362]TXG90945.1 DUF3710 domain-containing protein [Rhodococcus rhodnii]